mmetsp:Transcript_3811/g.6602  ORF Transcript_3811/g.6602 Transcript_3811/m.6602 type:complete len:200 (+) Transcript_3811:64-663(+)
MFQTRTVGSINRVPHATLAARSDSPIWYWRPREKEANDMGKVAIKIAALPCSSLSLMALARPTMIMGTRISFDTINIDNLNIPIENSFLVPWPCIHSPIANKLTGETACPSQVSAKLIQFRPSTQYSDGQRRYLPAVDRLRTNPQNIPHNTGFLRMRRPILPHRRALEMFSPCCTSDHHLTSSSFSFSSVHVAASFWSD